MTASGARIGAIAHHEATKIAKDTKNHISKGFVAPVFFVPS
jgi:hypothetical protein